jgi:hypothetical protein
VKLRLSQRDGFVRSGVDTAQRDVSINPLSKEPIVTAAVLDLPLFQRPISAPGRTATALQSLMREWEREAIDEEESETELMVMLSGMVSPSALSLSDE